MGQPTNCCLVDLAQAIVRAFDFQFDHAFGFYSALTGREVMRAQPKYEVFADMGERDDSGSVKRTRVARRSLKSGTRCCSSSTTAMIGGSWWR